MTMIQVSNNSRKTALVSAKLQTVINNRLREFFSLIIAGIGLIFLFALLSYNFDDPSFRNATGLVPKNMMPPRENGHISEASKAVELCFVFVTPKIY